MMMLLSMEKYEDFLTLMPMVRAKVQTPCGVLVLTMEGSPKIPEYAIREMVMREAAIRTRKAMKAGAG